MSPDKQRPWDRLKPFQPKPRVETPVPTESVPEDPKPVQADPVATEPARVDPPVKVVSPEQPKAESKRESIVIQTELDSYISERMKAQTKSLDELKADAIKLEVRDMGASRMALPDYFEKFSFDCTQGEKCSFHHKSVELEGVKRVERVTNRGEWVFRWIYKTKRALDRSLDVLGWQMVNRVRFPDAPNVHFTASGGIERGDAILAFLPVRAAIAMREAPAKASRERLVSQITVNKDEPTRAMMTGNPQDPHYYEPKLPREQGPEGSDQVDAGVVQEGRDF